MFLRKSKKKSVASRRESLDSVVVKNEHITEEKKENGEITLTVEGDTRSLPGKIMIHVFGLPRKREIILDRRGSFIWNCCNGSVTVGEMIDRFSREFSVNRKESEVSIMHFIKSLAKKGLAGAVVKENSGKKADSAAYE